MEKEVWKPVKGYEGLYEISTHGRVKSLRRLVKSSYNKTRTIKERILKPSLRNGYLAVDLSNTKRKTHNIHRLVAIAHIANPDNKSEVNHKDGVKTNPFCVNLEWATVSENSTHAFVTGLRNPTKAWLGKFGKDNNSSKAVIQLTLDGSFVKEYGSGYEAKRETGISNSSITAVIKGRQKTAGGYLWKNKIES